MKTLAIAAAFALGVAIFVPVSLATPAMAKGFGRAHTSNIGGGFHAGAVHAGGFHAGAFRGGWGRVRGGRSGWGWGGYDGYDYVDDPYGYDEPVPLIPALLGAAVGAIVGAPVTASAPAPMPDPMAWYFCDQSQAFFPYVVSCSSGFHPVPVGFNPYIPPDTRYHPSWSIGAPSY